jgi:glycosyltransferase involved in cell wall biosynthesis
MNVAIISTLASGGAAIAARNTQRALQTAGHNAAICFLETDSQSGYSLSWPGLPETEQIFWLNTTFHHWLSLAAASTNDLFSDGLSALFEISPQAKDIITKAEVVNLHWMAGLWPSPKLLDLLAGKRVVLTLHDMNAFTGGCHYHLSCRKFEQECNNCPLLPHSCPEDTSQRVFQLKKMIYPFLNPLIVTPSQWLANLSKTSALTGSCPHFVIPNAHDLSTFHPLPATQRAALRRRYGLAETSLVILAGAAAIDNPRKNLSMFFQAWKQFLASKLKPHPELLLFGSRPIPTPFPVRYAGSIDSPARMAELYNVADLFVQPSLLDNLPNTNCEAQSCGLPVLAFNTGGNAETFVPNESGMVIEEVSAPAMAAGLREMVNSPERLKDMRSKARCFAEENFCPDKLASAYMQAFTSAPPTKAARLPAEIKQELWQNQLISLAYLLRASNDRMERKIENIKKWFRPFISFLKLLLKLKGKLLN